MVAAVAGSISPELLLPSDKRIIILFLDLLSLNRFVAFAIAIPIAVPSYSRSATLISSIRLFNTSISTVNGHCIKD